MPSTSFSPYSELSASNNQYQPEPISKETIIRIVMAVVTIVVLCVGIYFMTASGQAENDILKLEKEKSSMTIDEYDIKKKKLEKKQGIYGTVGMVLLVPSAIVIMVVIAVKILSSNQPLANSLSNLGR